MNDNARHIHLATILLLGSEVSIVHIRVVLEIFAEPLEP